MTTVLSLRFPAGRYHATPWGHHVNEGVVEWPPSPWRLLRALTACWKRNFPEIPQHQVKPLFQALSAEPDFVLPAAAIGHTRHYMPTKKTTTLIFDTFLVLERNARLYVRWPVVLDDHQRELLSRFLQCLNVFGRAESWCEASLLDRGQADEVMKKTANCFPLNGEKVKEDQEIIDLLVPHPQEAFENTHFLTSKGKGRKKEFVYDPNWHLCVETGWLNKTKWSDPPGSLWVSYVRPKDCFEVQPARTKMKSLRKKMQVMRFALDSSVLPRVTETLPVAESVRASVMSLYGKMYSGRTSPMFSGKDESGDPLKGHRHAYYLPSDEDGDGSLDHLTIFALEGFSFEEIKVFDRLNVIRFRKQKEEAYPLRVLLLGMGTWEEYHPGFLDFSKQWFSATPYLATRYPKARGKNKVNMAFPNERFRFLEENLREQIAEVREDLANVKVEVHPLWDENQNFKIASRWRPIQFKRFRRKSNDDGGRRYTGAFRLVFEKEIQGPLALGWSNHFGMGLFLPDQKDVGTISKRV